MGNARKCTLSLWCLWLAGVAAVSIESRWRSDYQVKEAHNVPKQWTNLGLAPKNHSFELQIALRHNDGDALIQHLLEVSSPDGPRYGRHLSKQSIDDLIRPADTSVQFVEQWLAQHDINDLRWSASKDWVSAEVDVATAERLLDTEYCVYEHNSDNSLLVRTSAWSLPAELHDHIETIQPTTSFLRSRPKVQTPPEPIPPTYEEFSAEDIKEFGHIPIPDLADIPNPPSPADACNRLAISPLCLRTLYGTFGYEAKLPAGNQFAIVNFLEQSVNRSDLNLFLELYRPEAAESNAAELFQTEIVANGVDNQLADPDLGLEGALDGQYALAVGYPTPLLSYNVGGNAPFQPSAFTPNNRNEPYLVWLQHVLAQPTLPQVISISYADEEQTVPPAYAHRICHMFAQLGARGVTVLVSSGDEGVGHNGYCQPNNSTTSSSTTPGASSNRTTAFLPDFPASCPYVTSVGATRSLNPEVVAFDARTGFASGGGFSNYFPRPGYQKHAVESYINTVLGPDKHAGLWNRQGRGIPDIAASGYHYSIMWNATTHLTDGTSASAPTLAAVLALVNDALLAAGRPPMGFINPWLYQKGWRAFTDIVHGNATGCGTDGFPAAPGWDAASGFGTPWFPKLLELAFEDEYRPGGPQPWYMGGN